MRKTLLQAAAFVAAMTVTVAASEYEDYSLDGYDTGYFDSDFRESDGYDDAIHGFDFTDSYVEPVEK
jgi:hypothetical protein